MDEQEEAVTKPDRFPDLILKPGHAYWWNEMVFMHVHGAVCRIKINQVDGSFTYWWDGRYHPVPSEVKKAYDTWWFNTFESNFLSEE